MSTACTVMTAQQYEHTKLATNPPEIRLLKAVLDTSTDQIWDSIDQVKLEMQVHSLDKLPPYFALSYTWGNPTLFTELDCNGQKIRVNENLARALHTVICTIHARKGVIWEKLYTLGEEIYVWADGLCIDQSNFTEKNTQIPLMSDIYRKAREVVGYIGAPQHTDPVEAFQAMFFGNNAALYSFKAHDAADADWKELWSQPWFGRCWVIQEVILGTVMCVYGNGTSNSSWPLSLYQKDELWFHVMDLFPRDGDWSIGFNMRQTYTWNQAGLLWRMDGKWLGMVRHMLGSQAYESAEKAGAEMDFLHALCYARSAQATDARDKVYAIMGLLNESDRQSVKVDYSPAYTTAQLYLDTALHFIKSGEGVRLLEHAGTSRSIEGLPTWVPDWQSEPRYPLSSFYYAAARSVRPNIRLHSEDPNRLVVRGVIVDGISITGWRSNYLKGKLIQELEVQDPRTHLVLMEANAINICAGIQQLTENKSKYYTGEEYSAVVWRTLTADIGNDTPRAAWDDERCYTAWSELVTILRARMLEEFYAADAVDDTEDDWEDVDDDDDLDFEGSTFAGQDEAIAAGGNHNDATDTTNLANTIENTSITTQSEQTSSITVEARSPDERDEGPKEEESRHTPENMDNTATQIPSTGQPAPPSSDTPEDPELDSLPAILPTLPQPSSQHERELEHKGRPFEIKARRLLYGRMLVGTDGGLLGAVPHDAEGRDLIVCIAGANVPFVLRPVAAAVEAGEEDTSQGEQEYLLVGACYVHGLMDGLIPSRLHTMDFVLR